MKNIVDLHGKPLLHYVASAAAASRSINRTFVSTEDASIEAAAKKLDLAVHPRPLEHGSDDSPVIDTVLHFLAWLETEVRVRPSVLVLLQPTSPFLRPGQIDACVDLLTSNEGAQSAQTVVPVPHHQHAYNQRVIQDGVVEFCFADLRENAYRKQLKPQHFAFGNVVATRISAIRKQRTLFAQPSMPIEIGCLDAIDIDHPSDLELAEILMAHDPR